MSASALYFGHVIHRRHQPHAHAFRYPVAQLLLDLDELDTIFAGRWLWSLNRHNLAEFRRSDYFGDPSMPLPEAVRRHVAGVRGHRPAGPIRLLCVGRLTPAKGQVLLLQACAELVKDGFEVLCYSSDDAILAQRLRDAGATSVMPAGSPIGSGRGVANPEAIAVLLQVLKSPEHGGRADYPVIVDAGVGTPSDVTIAMELGADGVLLNTGIAHASDPVRMAHAMRMACDAGYLGARAGRIPRKLLGSASSPWSGTFVHIPGE
jgi:hypothetical protein